ncbi:MAG TPA: transposon-transfer assisting family protein [Clostridia bacterium]|nr:transposon-transfer assisting family protein [Clostridia bacterium]
MNTFTNDEINLMCIYNTGTKDGLMDALTAMREYLEPEESELRDLTDSVLEKLEVISEEDFAAIELFPDFDDEE